MNTLQTVKTTPSSLGTEDEFKYIQIKHKRAFDPQTWPHG